MRDGQLRFDFASVQRELLEMERLAHKFLHRRSAARMTLAAQRLDYLRHQRGQHRWGLPSERPLVTLPTRGYERGVRKGRHDLRAMIDSSWEITPENDKTFRVTGNVSTRVRLLDAEELTELGRWRVELGTEGAPGCFFHTQIRGQDGDDAAPWPHSVPVPRLPTPFISIPGVVAFVLGELFQTEWARHVAGRRSERLASDQRHHWARRLRWEQEIAKNSSGTLPWAAIKSAVPHRDLFLKEENPEVFVVS